MRHVSKKFPTNEDVFKNYLKTCDPVNIALTRERLLKIAEITLNAIEKNPESFNVGFIHHSVYIRWAKEIQKFFEFIE